MHDDFDIICQQLLEFFKQSASPLINFFVVLIVERTVLIIDAEFVVVVQVVRSSDDADQTAKMVLPNPDDFLLAANPAMIVPIATRTFAHSEAVFNNPCEVPGGNSQSPFSS